MMKTKGILKVCLFDLNGIGFEKLIKRTVLIVANENTSHLLLSYFNCAN